MIKKRVLVTGGAGFLGSHLCQKLIEKNYDVICIDNLQTGARANIAHLESHPNFELIEHDISRSLYIDVDEIYNLACPASPIHYQQDPIQTMKTNVFGTLNMLGIAKRCKAKLLQASTSEVYGDPTMHPQKEEYWGHVNPIGYRACYDEGKRCAETLCFDYHRKHHVKIRVVRIFNTYGPKMQLEDGRAISNLIVQALKGEALTVYGDGTQTRSFCYVDDLVDGLIKMMEHPGSITGPINLGNPIELSIGEVAKMIQSIIDPSLDISYRNLPEDDPKMRRPDISLAVKHLGWEPKVALEEGLKKTIEYFKESIEGQVSATAY